MCFAGSRILDTLILYYTKWSNDLKSTYYAEKTKIRKKLSDDDFCKVIRKVDDPIEKEKIKSVKTHHNKLIRDRERLRYRYTELDDVENIVETASTKIKHKRKRKPNKKKCRNKNHTRIKRTTPDVKNIDKEVLQNCVINLASKQEQISEHQLILFYLGKSFAPTPKLPTYEAFREDVLQFAYKLRWAWFFYTNPSNNTTNSTARQLEVALIEKSATKQIRSSNNPCLELFIQKVTEELLLHKSNFSKKLPDNLPPESRKELYALKQRNDIVIRPADKGSKFFIMDRAEYVGRVKEQLADTSTFKCVPDKAKAIKEVTEAITNWTAEFNEEPGMALKLRNWLIPDENCKPGNNYINPKAHKPEKSYPGRLISTGCSSYTKNLTALTAYELSNISSTMS